MVFDTAFSIGNDVPVHATFPELVEENDKLAWKLSDKKLTSIDADTVKVQTEKVPISVAPQSQVNSQVEWTQGVISALPVHVDYSVTFNDDSIHTFKLEGFYDQTAAAGYKMNKTEIKLPEGGSCIRVSESQPSKVENLRQNKDDILTKEDLPEFFNINE